MKDILEAIVANKQKELEQWKQYVPLKQLYGIIEYEGAMTREVPSLKAELSNSSTLGVIAEFVRKTPALGWINKDAKIRNIGVDYAQYGASSISIPTDFTYFGGYDEFVQEVRAVGVTLPLLYKNYIIDEYQLFQAKHAGASAVILTAVLLEIEHCHSLVSLAHQLGMEVALELHTAEELDYLACAADMVIVNNRKACSFEMDINRSLELVKEIPADTIKISEGGIDTSEKAKQLATAGYRGVIIGELFMQTGNPGLALDEFIKNLKE
ncbi:indole-3-glycerol-phosphate synthase [Prevotella aurantiaca]|jgi:indole-3-glycerol phosphate synthase|uniref:indole-3-glycerol phosphate synthase TrpC n=1 Tax=Prevotella aurantiaca TaxID=596085 RepID=UPI001CB55E24|nr:indole-3-glycerol phosphate synthase TrpC [Prevotella aurantiaca]MBF1385624.1 indole-3-glycerol-phosphate synthase [Prevotella aurantiaca]